MFDFIIYCAGLVGVVILCSFVCELIENCRNNSWRKRVTADDIARATDPPWMKGFGGLSDLAAETARIRGMIEEEFE